MSEPTSGGPVPSWQPVSQPLADGSVIEIAVTTELVGLRSTTRPSSQLWVPLETWWNFLRGARDGRFDAIFTRVLDMAPPERFTLTAPPDDFVILDDEAILGNLRLSNVHSQDVCGGRPCTVHNRTDHHMRSWPLRWRADRGIFERACSHFVGHPDPDQEQYWEEGCQGFMSVHGCDGCCAGPES